MKTFIVLSAVCALSTFIACSQTQSQKKGALLQNDTSSYISKTKEQLKKVLTKEQYYVACEKGTEAPFTGAYWDNHEKGNYYCVICNNLLFSSETKYDSGTGWPSFYKSINDTCVKTAVDSSYGMARVEITCAKCHAHLGHVFDDGPPPTGLRYCTNSASMKFVKK